MNTAAHRDANQRALWQQDVIHESGVGIEAEDARARSEHFARTIVSSVGAGVIVYDRQLRYQVWNRFMEELTGMPAHDVIGRHALEYFPHLRSSGIDVLLERALAGESVRSEDTPYHAPQTGRQGWVTAFYSPHIAADGEIIGVVAIIHDVTERRRAAELLQYNAFHDSLTGLPNRALFIDRLERLLTQAQRRAGYTFAVLFLDLDRFKLVNDSLGHSAGDELLLAIGHRLETCLREGDSVARLGGDEFAILLDDIADSAEAIRIADRIQRALQTSFMLQGHEVFTSASIGIALSSADYIQPGDVLRDADIAMYHARNAGRGRYELFDRVMHHEAVEQLKVETELRHAVERGELILHYQPIVALERGEVTGFEALVRWQHPRHGLLQAARFISMAEETGMIVPIGWWALRAACTQVRRWRDTYPWHDGLAVSVNLSSRQFVQEGLVEQILSILEETRCPASALKLEITESVIMHDAARALVLLRELRGHGVGICIDDFGTGYSSLGYLKNFPVETLKIDRSFVAQVDETGRGGELIEMIVALGSILGATAVAEGVETPEQLALVRRLGSHYAQGFYFAAALETAAAEELLGKATPVITE